MKWFNLKQNKCPKCESSFHTRSFARKGYIQCNHCDFVISEKRFSEIVNSQIAKDLEEKWDKELALTSE